MTPGSLDVSRVLKFAAEEFALHGFEGMSMRSLSDRCSVSAPTLYYHFRSKEELYEEACGLAFDEIIDEVLRRVETAPTPEAKLEQFVGALFDQWTSSTVALLLTQRDVINTRTRPERCLASTHYQRFMRMIHDILSKYVLKDVDEHFVLTFGSLMLGYCSLMSYDQRESRLSPQQFLDSRRAVLVSYCKQLWSSPSPPIMEPSVTATGKVDAFER